MSSIYVLLLLASCWPVLQVAAACKLLRTPEGQVSVDARYGDVPGNHSEQDG